VKKLVMIKNIKMNFFPKISLTAVIFWYQKVQIIQIGTLVEAIRSETQLRTIFVAQQ